MRLDLLKTILWLRWKLSANQFARAGAWLRLVSVLILIAAGLFMCVVSIGGFFLGRTVLVKLEPDQFMLVIDGLILGFLFFWCIGILSEVQRSESIDLQRLLHLPVKLKDAFVVNYVASHVSISLLLVTPALIGMTLGLMTVGRFSVAMLIPLFVAFVFAVSSWTYCLRGWLVRLMVNPRRRRSIIIGMTIVIVMLAQAPNLFFNVYLRGFKETGVDKSALVQSKMEQAKGLMKRAHYYVPPLWVGLGTAKAMGGTWWPAAGAILMFGLVGAAGVTRAYQSTVKFYRGENRDGPAKSVGKQVDDKPVKNTIEGDLPFVGGDVSAAALTFWRSMLRAPEMKMALLGPIIIALVIMVMFFSRDIGSSAAFAGPLIAISVTLFSMSGVLQIVFNLFGWDREGFRALVLSPIDRSRLLLAKNISVFPVLAGLGGLLFVGMSVMLKLNPIAVIGGLFQIITASVILCVIGNYFSITMPHRIQVGSLKPTKMPMKNIVVMLVFTLFFPVYMLPVLLGPMIGALASWAGSEIGTLLNIGISGAICVASILFYAFTNRPLGRLLQTRERGVLQIVTSELE